MGSALRVGIRSALVTLVIVFFISLVRPLVNLAFDRKWMVNWGLILVLSGLASIVVFLWTFLSILFSLRGAAPALAVLERDPSLSLLPSEPLSGFVGMEYHGAILNRTYLIFAAADGLYGWKVEGPVTNARPNFYEPYQNMLEDQELMRDMGAVRDLSKLQGGFFIPSGEIAVIEASDRAKWGMGGIPHSGRIRIGLTSGKLREFIVLGAVNPQAIRARFISRTAQGAAISTRV